MNIGADPVDISANSSKSGGPTRSDAAAIRSHKADHPVLNPTTIIGSTSQRATGIALEATTIKYVFRKAHMKMDTAYIAGTRSAIQDTHTYHKVFIISAKPHSLADVPVVHWLHRLLQGISN